MIEAARVLEQLQHAGVYLWSDGKRLRYRAPRGALTPDMKSAVASCRDDLVRLLKKTRPAWHRIATRRPDPYEPVPLTPAQAAIWVAEVSGLAGDAFHIGAALELSGPLDRTALRETFELLMRRHEALRSCIKLIKDEPHQCVAASPSLPWTEAELPANDDVQDEESLRAWLRSLMEASFHLERPPLWRVGLARWRADQHVLAVVLHHLIADGRSVAVLLRELSATYEHLSRGQVPDLPPPPLGFPDVALWQAEGRSADGDSASVYWRETLAGAPIGIDSWPDFRRPAITRLDAELVRGRLDAVTTDGLRRIATEHGTTLFTVLWALFATLLHRYGAGDDIVVVTPVIGREQQELEDVVGLLTNRVPLRADLSGDPSFRALVGRAALAARGAFAHSDFPFEELIKIVSPTSPGQYMPFAQILFAFHNVVGGPPELSGLQTRPRDIGTQTAKAELYLSVEEETQQLALALEFPPALFERARMMRLLEHYGNLARAAVANPEVAISCLPLMHADERAQVLALGAGPAVPTGQDTIFTRFRAVAVQQARQPALIAPESWDDLHVRERWPTLTYDEVVERAESLALHLTNAGPLIGVAIPRSAELIIALLATLASGNAYLALDPDLPRAHAAILREQAGVRALIVDAARPPSFMDLFESVVPVRATEREGSRRRDQPVAAGGSERLAYVMFTSGSTGTPKGVAVTNRNVLHFIDALPRGTWQQDAVVLHFAPSSFDASVMEIWGALLTGAQLLIAPPGLPSLRQLAQLIQSGAVNFAWLTASLFHSMSEHEPEALLSLDQLIAGGDVLSLDTLRTLFGANRKGTIANGYGPTETTVLATYHEIRPTDLSERALSVPIGRPLGGARLYCVDCRGEPVPQGIPGELWVGGAGVAAGYISQPELTAERFLPDPFAAQQGARLYRTGDRARFREDGTVEFLGRLDQQIKIRGFRIEPAEIEACLLQHDDILSAVVTAPLLTGQAERRLIAYVVPREGSHPDRSALRAHVSARLPAQMVPAHYVVLAALPLTRNGKLDRSALPLPSDETGCASAGDEAISPAERALTEIWKDLLGVSSIGLDDQFFELGGDSIRAMQLAIRASRAGWRFSAQDALRHQTIRTQARAARKAPAHQSVVATPSSLALTPVQHWFLSLAMPTRVPWNQAVRLVLDKNLPKQSIEAALAQLEVCHEALRLRFTRRDDEWQVRVAPPGRPVMDVLELGTGVRPEERIETALTKLHQMLDLEHGPVWRALWIAHSPSHCPELVLTAHHLVIDAVSWRILLEDLAALLIALRRGDKPGLPAPPASLGDWSKFLNDRAERAAGEAALWCDRPPCGSVGIPPGETANIEANVDVLSLALDRTLSAALLSTANVTWRTTTADLLLAGLCMGYQAITGEHSLLLDLEHHGRAASGSPDLSRTIGWFTTIAPLVVTLLPHGQPADCVLAVKEAVRQAPDSGIGFGLLRYLGGSQFRSALAALQPPEVSFNYLGQIHTKTAPDSGFCLSKDEVGRTLHPDAPRPYRIEVGAIAMNGRLRIDWRFGRGKDARSEIGRWSEATRAALGQIAAVSAADRDGRLTPSDVLAPSGQRPGQAELDRVLSAARLPARAVAFLLRPNTQQEGVLFETLTQRSGIHVEQFLIQLTGPLDRVRLAHAWAAVLKSFPALRSAFLWRETSRPLQAILREAEPAWHYDDLSELSPAFGRKQIDQWLARDRARGFDLDAAPLLRLALFKTGAEQWVLGWSFHHILLDGWSVALVLEAVMQAYEGNLPATRSTRADTDDNPVSYAAWLAAQPENAAQEFWQQELAGLAPIRPLGMTDPTPAEEGYEETDLDLDECVSQTLARIAGEQGVTLSTVVQAAWSCVLARCGSADVVLGVTVSGRPEDLPGSQEAIGLFVNSLPLRLQVPKHGRIHHWFREVQRRGADIRRYEQFGAGRIHAWSRLPAWSPLFDSLIAFENYPFDRVRAAAARSAVAVTGFEAHGARTRHPLTLVVMPGTRLRVRLVAALSRIARGEGRRYLKALRRVLDHVASVAAADFDDLTAVLPGRLLPRARPAALPPPATDECPENSAELAVTTLWREVLGAFAYGKNTNFFDVGGHSLLSLELLRRWRERFGRDLPLSAFLRAPTIAGLARLLTDGAPAAEAKLITLSDANALPLFLAPGAAGNSFAYRPLARALEPRCAVVGYAAEVLLDREGVAIEDLGADFAQAIANRQPDGPLGLVGHSLGAAIAYAAAEILQAQGRLIERLVLIDLPARGPHEAAARDEAQWLCEIVEAIALFYGKPLLRIPRAELAAASAPRRRGIVLDRLVDAEILPAGSGTELIDRLLARYRSAFAALAAWRPGRLAVPVLVVRSATTDGEAEDLGWGGLCSHLTTASAPGDHISMIVEPNVRALAAILGESAGALQRPQLHLATRSPMSQ
jgi:amino acid adenylation domain-containing protein/non-ribosomal peptide synthase protein (TIGR01720 family)